MPPPRDLAGRIRRARQTLEMTQAELATAVGVDIRTVQGWESGRRPRGGAGPIVERVLGIDLNAEPESTSPRLDEATDAQIIADLAGRLADRGRTIAELRRRLGERAADDHAEPGGSGGDGVQDGSNVITPHGRWAARPRKPSDNTP